MGKIMVISPFPYAEIPGGVGGYLKDFTNKNPDLDAPEKPYVYYLTASDLEDKIFKNFVDRSTVLYEILQWSKFVGFNYKIQYLGRAYYNKLNQIAYEELLTVIAKEIRFVKPTIIFIPSINTLNPSTEYLSKVAKQAIRLVAPHAVEIEYLVEYFDKGETITGNFFFEIKKLNGLQIHDYVKNNMKMLYSYYWYLKHFFVQDTDLFFSNINLVTEGIVS